MDLHFLKTASGLVLIGSFAFKALLHILLDIRKNPRAGMIVFLLSISRFFKPYSSDVKQQDARVKDVCNSLFYLSAAALLINLVVGVVMLFE